MMETKENTKTCPHDCTRCTPNQRLLCAAQFSMMTTEMMYSHEERLERMEDRLKKLVDDGGGVFNPLEETQEAAV